MRFTAETALVKKAMRLLGCPESSRSVFAVSITAQRASDGSGSVGFSTLEGVKFVSVQISAEVVTEGEALIPSRYLPFFEGDSESLTVARRGGAVDLIPSGFTIPFHTGEAALPPDIAPLGSATFALADIQGLFRKVMFATGDDRDPLRNMKCVLLDCSSADWIMAVGSDKTIIAVSRMPKGSPFRGMFVLPKGGVQTINRLEGDMITLTFYHRAIRATVSGQMHCEIYMPEFSTPFPRYEEVMDVAATTTLRGAREELLGHLAAARKVSDDIHLQLFHKDYVRQPVKLYAREQDGALINRSVPVEWTGDDIRIRVNGRTLQQAIENAEGRIRIDFTCAEGRIAVTEEDRNYRAVMLPYTAAEKR